jgi:adenylylsulfate kinase
MSSLPSQSQLLNGPWVEVVDKPIRSAIKSVSYRLFGSSATALISYLFTHNATASLSIGLVEFCSKFGLFYIHERLWTKVNFGRKKVFHDYEI